MAETVREPMTASHARMIVAATLAAGYAASTASNEWSAERVYNEYCKFYQKVMIDDVNPSPILNGQRL